MAAPLGTSDRRRGRCRDRRAAHRAAHRRAAHRRAAHRRAAHRRAAHCRDRCGAQAMGCGGGDLARPRRRENARGADPCRDQSRRDEGASAAEEATTTCADSAAAAPAVGLAAADGLPARRPPRIFSRGAALRPSRTKNCQTTTSSLAWRAAARGQTPLPSRDLTPPSPPPRFLHNHMSSRAAAYLPSAALRGSGLVARALLTLLSHNALEEQRDRDLEISTMKK